MNGHISIAYFSMEIAIGPGMPTYLLRMPMKRAFTPALEIFDPISIVKAA